MTTNHRMSLSVDNAFDGKRLDVFLSEKIEKTTRSLIQMWIENDCVTLRGDDKDLKASLKIRTGNVFDIKIPQPVEAKPKPVDIPLNILYEDEHLLVIDKQAGLVVHPGPGHFQDTLVNALLYHCKDLSGIGGELRPGIVHRLDKDTSGTMVIAKSDHIHHQLSLQFQQKNEKDGVLREYVGFCFGQPIKKNGIIETNIIRHNKDRQKMMACEAGGKEATTLYNVVKTFTSVTDNKMHYISKIEFTLATGRTHQIRVHSSYIKCPLIGDPIYGHLRLQHYKKYWPEYLFTFNRQALHAQKLGFVHPISKEYLLFETDLPDDLRAIEECLDDH
jgi:23S rRNA pseudouridine1911/1915/1917 synthase